MTAQAIVSISADVAITMTSREIAELTGKRHDQVLRTARDLVQQGVTQSVETPYRHEQNGVDYPEHHLSKRDSLVLVARLSPEFTGRVVDRWLELETATQPQFNIPSTLSSALRLAAEQAERIEQQTKQLEAARPAVEFVDRYVESTGSKSFRQVCKLLGANENRFREFLLDKKTMYRLGGEWAPYADHMEAGRFEVRAGTAEVSQHAYNQAKFTPKGINWIAGEWGKHLAQLREADVAIPE